MSGNDLNNKDLVGKTAKPVKSKSKKTSLVKKLTSLKKHKVNPKKDDDTEGDATSQTSIRSLLKQKTIGGNLSNSSPSFRIAKSNEKLNTDDIDDVYSSTSMVSHSNIKLPYTESLTIDLSDRITTNKIETLTIAYNDIKQVSESSRDKPPAVQAPSVPYNITEEDVASLINYKLQATPNPDPVSTGAIRKNLENLKAQKRLSRDEFFEPIGSMKPSEIPKLLRRLSSDTRTVSESRRQSIEHTNKTEQKPIDDDDSTTTSHHPIAPPRKLSTTPAPATDTSLADTTDASEIKFDIGTLVRPQKIISVRRGSNLLRPGEDFSSLETAKSESSLESDSFRRKIQFVTQSTSDEQDNLNVGSSESREHPSYLSVLSDLSFEGEFLNTANSGMAPHGDLITPDSQETNMSSSPRPLTVEKREYLYKILVIGELGTGKTSFIRRYVHNFFSQNYRATIGVDFALKVLNWDQKTIIRLQLWDIAGQERFGNMTRVYYKEAAGAFIVFDVTRNATFDAVIKWKQDLDSKVQLPDGSPIPCILLANKCDQAKQGTVNSSSKIDEYVKENGFAGWFETSAKDNINIEDASKALVNKILQNDRLINAGVVIDNDKIALDGQSDNQKASKKNCVSC